jgi:hypothetical protein
MNSRTHISTQHELTSVTTPSAIGAATVQPGHASFGLPLRVAVNIAELPLAMGKLARAPISAVSHFVPVAAHFCLIQRVGVYIQMPRRQVGNFMGGLSKTANDSHMGISNRTGYTAAFLITNRLGGPSAAMVGQPKRLLVQGGSVAAPTVVQALARNHKLKSGNYNE